MGKRIKFNFEIKLQAVSESMNGAGSAELARKYGCSYIQINRWVNRYNGYEGNLKAYKANGGITVIKGRKTTFQERINIVEDCLKNGGDYNATALKFNISYNQIYSWVNKYKSQGVVALKDNRGKGKSLEDMNNVEQLEAENKLLRAKLQRLEMEVDLKKKLNEVQMRLEFTIRNKK